MRRKKKKIRREADTTPTIPFPTATFDSNSVRASLDQLAIGAKEFDRHAAQDDTADAVAHAELVARLRSRFVASPSTAPQHMHSTFVSVQLGWPPHPR